MITAHHIYKNFGIRRILQDVSFTINEDERVGLIGPNGCGKTTLLKILAGVESPDLGIITRSSPNLRIGFLAQGINNMESSSTIVKELSMESVLNPSPDSSEDLEAEVASLAGALSNDPDNPSLQSKYDSALYHLTRTNLNPQAVLASLGLNDIPLDTSIQRLSGDKRLV